MKSPSSDAATENPATAGPGRLQFVIAVLALTLFVVWPPLHLQSIWEMHAIKWSGFLTTLLIVVVLTVAIVTVIYFVSGRDSFRAIIWSGVVLFGFFGWSALAAIGDGIPTLPVIGNVVPLVLIGLFVWLTARLWRSQVHTAVMLGIAIALVVVAAVPIARLSTATPASPATVPVAGSATAPRPDVLIVVLDGYARQDILKRDYAFSNNDFLDGLVARDLRVVDDAFANYTATYYSLSSFLAADYTVDEGVNTLEEAARATRLLSGDNLVFKSFRDAGYRTIMLENGWQGSSCRSNVDVCVRDGFFMTSVWWLSRMTILAPFADRTIPVPINQQSMAQIQVLADQFESGADGRPTLMYAHIELPHPPTQRDANCEVRNESWARSWVLGLPGISDELVAKTRAGYVDQMQCTNRLVLEQLDAIRAENQDAVVVLLADHGPDSRGQTDIPFEDWSDDELSERVGILMALPTSGPCSSESVRTPVELSRHLLRCALGADVAPIERRAFIVPPETHLGRALEATERVL